MRRNTWDLKQLKELRLSRHWSQEQLAELSGLSSRTIQRIEQGHKVDVGSIKLLAGALEMDVDDLLGPERMGQAHKEEVRSVARFNIALAAAIVFIVSKLILAIYSIEEGIRAWTGFVVATLGALILLSFIAEKNLGKGVTLSFMNKVFGRGFTNRTPLSRSIQTSLIVLISIVIMILYMLFPEFIKRVF